MRLFPRSVQFALLSALVSTSAACSAATTPKTTVAVATSVLPHVVAPANLPTSSTTVAPVPSTAAAPAPSPPPPSSTTLPPPALKAFAAVRADGYGPYQGLGTWADAYDWSVTFGTSPTSPQPSVGIADIDRMAAVGVQTLFLQTTKFDSPTTILEPDRVGGLIRRAHQRGIRVVAWYLPSLDDPTADVRRLVASARLGVDGIAVDIESRRVADVALRNRRLIDVSAALRRALPGQVIGAIVLPPVVTDVINPAYWPAFPWQQLKPYYDVWIPMGYWTNRTVASGWRDAARYTSENVARIRAHLAAPVPVHVVGGIADTTTPADVVGMERVAVASGALGASLYDWATTGAGLWPFLAPLHLR